MVIQDLICGLFEAGIDFCLQSIYEAASGKQIADILIFE
jgi:hypothetical protein